MRLIFVAFCIALAAPLALAAPAINPKQVSEATIDFVLSGSLAVDGDIDSANLTLYVPQDGVTSFQVTGADGWSYITDAYGNRLLLLEWNKPSGTEQYRAAITVHNRAQYLSAGKPLADAPQYLRENGQVEFTDELREMAYPYERTLEKAAELTELVHAYITYDLSLVGQLKPSGWVYENRRGVCVEYANMLSSLLKLSGIPTRYVVGYAYSSVQEKLIGHTWVEVLAADGSWISLDPTWLQTGYLDATHIKTAVREDANQSELLNYRGRGSIDWQRNEDRITLSDYTLENITTIALQTKKLAIGEEGFVKAHVSTGTLTMVHLNITSCIRNDGSPMLTIQEPVRTYWGASQDVYWFFETTRLKDGFSYTCPVTVYDQTGSTETVNVEISGTRRPSSVDIEGPETVSINERFTLTAHAGESFLFYAPAFGLRESAGWPLQIGKPGTYTFYLYADGALAKKTVTVQSRKAFSLSIAVPANATVGSNFTALVTVTNLLSEAQTATLATAFEGTEYEKTVMLGPSGQHQQSYTFTPSAAGRAKVSATVYGDTVTSYSASITVYDIEQPRGPLDSILDTLGSIFRAIAGFISSLLQ
ncbi:MAG: hypothetical protein HYY37_00195 [Candidatus Aenigmarchaeota archaeon]|nr:hypothetical protein [Candidatus Aenigmarchaeota archaeon]